MRKVVFIVGTGHSGTTLLDLILGSQSKAFSLGELASIPNNILKQQPVRFCRVCPGECPVWDQPHFKQLFESYFKWARTDNRLLIRLNGYLGSFRKNIYAHLFESIPAQVLIDSSKSPSWARRQLRPFWYWKGIDPFLLYVCRDGRGVVSSYLRKYPDRDFASIARQWAKVATAAERFYDTFPDRRKVRIHYEQMALEPAHTIGAICRKLNIEYEPEMLEYWRHDHHILEGNWGTISLIKKYQQKHSMESVNVQEKRKSRNALFYDAMGLKIQPDLRWKEELSQEQLEIFDQVAGNVNKAYAFEWKVPSQPA